MLSGKSFRIICSKINTFVEEVMFCNFIITFTYYWLIYIFKKNFFICQMLIIIIILKVDLKDQNFFQFENLLKFIKQHKINNNDKMFSEFIVIFV